MAKQHINCTNRILLKKGVIYCSCDIVSQLRGQTIRANQRIAILKGEYDSVLGKLKELAKQKPNHFLSGSRALLEGTNVG